MIKFEEKSFIVKMVDRIDGNLEEVMKKVTLKDVEEDTYYDFDFSIVFNEKFVGEFIPSKHTGYSSNDLDSLMKYFQFCVTEFIEKYQVTDDELNFGLSILVSKNRHYKAKNQGLIDVFHWFVPKSEESIKDVSEEWHSAENFKSYNCEKALLQGQPVTIFNTLNNHFLTDEMVEKIKAKL